MNSFPGEKVVAFEVLSGPADGSVLAVSVTASQAVRVSDAPGLDAVAAETLPGGAGTVAVLAPGDLATLRLLAGAGTAPAIDGRPASPGAEVAVGQILRLGATEFLLQQVGSTLETTAGGITCPKCGTLNPTEIRWCRNCGFELLPPDSD